MNIKLFYGSKQKPKDVFGDGTPEFYAFHAANKQVAPGAVELMDVLLASWQPYTLSHDWVLPDGFTVYCPVMSDLDVKIEVDELDHASFVYRHKVNAGTEKGLSIAANVIHSIDGMVVREMARRCNYDHSELCAVRLLIGDRLQGFYSCSGKIHPMEKLATETEFLSLVAIDHIHERSIHDFSDEYLKKLLVLIERCLAYKSFELVCIHDEFKALPNNINVVRKTYNDIMAEISESSILEFILSKVKSMPVQIEKYTADLGELIREANYSLS